MFLNFLLDPNVSQKIIAAQNKVALTYHRVRELYFMAVIFTTTIILFIFHKLKAILERGKMKNPNFIFLKRLLMRLFNFGTLMICNYLQQLFNC